MMMMMIMIMTAVHQGRKRSTLLFREKKSEEKASCLFWKPAFIKVARYDRDLNYSSSSRGSSRKVNAGDGTTGADGFL